MSATGSSAAFAQGEKPAALSALEAQGVTVVGPLPSRGGLKAWAAYSGQHPVALYGTPDGKYVIAGTMLDAAGNDVNRDTLEKSVSQSMTNGAWSQLERARWVLDGSIKAPRIVYVFTDPNCPYCNKFWGDSRPWVASGKVQLRHILIGILSPTSAGKAAAILIDSNPSLRLENHERGQMAAGAKILATGRPVAMGDSALKPLAEIPAAIESQLASNAHMMQAFGISGTPGLVWQDAHGKIQMRAGAPAALQEIFGPK
ncbi:MAG TPA: thiol:disulfide interchange protein DsbG [Herbaspirillum sp.]|jgi:thiol:disulfide interchange protein DsbG